MADETQLEVQGAPPAEAEHDSQRGVIQDVLTGAAGGFAAGIGTGAYNDVRAGVQAAWKNLHDRPPHDDDGGKGTDQGRGPEAGSPA
jgi:hypothetical protein